MSKSKIIFIAIAAVLIAALMAGCSSPAAGTAAASGDNVSINYILRSENGTVLDTSYADVASAAGIYIPERKYAPYNFTVGSESIIEGVSDAVIGMKVGETKNATILPAKAYGDYDPTLIQPMNLSTLTEANITPYVNQTLGLMFGGTARVDSIDADNDTVYLDYNHRLAGQTLKFTITLLSID